jgi:predicted anti-sigma-YlaC factor YlaD
MMSQPMNTVIKKELDKQVPIEAVTIATGKRDEFERLMDLALQVDADAVPEARVANALFQRRARWLRSHADQFFSQ